MSSSQKLVPTLVLSLFLSLTVLSGCGVSPADMAAPVAVAGAAMQGHIHGGQQPVVGAHVYLMQASTNGYGGAATSELNSAAIFNNPAGGNGDSIGTYVLTDGSGNFTITGGYHCSVGSPVYLLALGGNPGLDSGTDNTALALMAVLGQCPSGTVFPSSLFINVDEVSTVAAVYALSGFLSGPTSLSIPASDALATTGLANAINNAAQLVDPSTGTVPATTPNGAGVNPIRRINTLANIIASCINSDGSLTTITGGVTTATTCGTLFANATSDGTASGTQPTDTITALLNIAHHPAANVANLYPLNSGNAPFQPAQMAQPDDLTVSIVFSVLRSGTYWAPSPGIPAVDADGNIFLPSRSLNQLTKVSPLGMQVLSFGFNPNTGMSMAAVDPFGNVWTAHTSGGLVTKFPSDLTSYNMYSYNGTTNDDGHQLAIDAGGYVYISDYTNATIFKLNNGGTSQTFINGDNDLESVAVGNAGEIMTNFANVGAPLTLADGGGTLVQTCETGCGGITNATSEASDASDHAWYINSNSTLSGFSPGSNHMFDVLPGSPFSGGGLNVGTAELWVAVDGGGNVWVPNYVGASISEFSNAGVALSPDTGFTPAQTTCAAQGLAIDGSGDVWVTCDSTTQPLVEYIGAATPLYTPLTPGHLGIKP